MSDSLYSIYQKYCPKCMAPSPANVDRCGCGHHFGDSGPASRWQQVLEDERLYHDYLAARAAQAAHAAAAARTAHVEDPKDPRKKADALKAIDEAEAARAALAAQVARLTEMANHQGKGPRVVPSTAVFRSVSQAAPDKREAASGQSESVSASAQAVVQAAQALQAELASMRRTEPAAGTRKQAKRPVPGKPPVPVQAKTAAGATDRAPTPVPESKIDKPRAVEPVAKVADAKASKTTAPQRAPEPAKRHVAKAMETVRPEGAASVPVVGSPQPQAVAMRAPQQARGALGLQECPNCTAALPPGARFCGCGFAAAPAELVDVTAALPTAGAPEPSSRKNAPARIRSEAERVARKIEARQSIKDCPHCTASVAMAAARCKCGYVFPSIDRGGLMPSLSLDAGELQDLNKTR